jgi:putative ATP-binding cassette transporter
LVRGDHANPEYRIALSAVTFIAVLWTIGGALHVNIAGSQLQIPGFLVVAALIYALVASGSMMLIGSRFVQASENKNQAEAEYRYVITRLRENGESIALSRGEEEERTGVDHSLRKVLAAWREIAVQNMKTTVVSQTSSYIAPVLPIILCAPKFLDGSMSLGEVMQAASAFTIVQGAFNWLVDNYPKMADWTASARRVATLMVALDALEEAKKATASAALPSTPRERVRHCV